MKTKVLLFVSLMFVVLAVCSKDNGNSVEDESQAFYRAGQTEGDLLLTNFTYTGCKGETRSQSPTEHFELTAVKDGGLMIKHVDVLFNCGSDKFEAEASLDGQNIFIKELSVIRAEYLANCLCPFDLGYEIGPLEEGVTYTMTITSTYDFGIDMEEYGLTPDWNETTITFTYSPTLSGVFSSSTDMTPAETNPHSSAAIYNLQGVKLDSNGHQPSKGIYIQSGKKVVIK